MQEGDLAPVIIVTDTVARQRRLLTGFPRSTAGRDIPRQPAPYLNCDRPNPAGIPESYTPCTPPSTHWN
jgi:hypothetical protein